MTTERLIRTKNPFSSLQERIEQGHYPPGSWLPTERVLAQEFGVDRSAIRRALLQLEHQGLIVREAGRRPWVREESVSSRQAMDNRDEEKAPETKLQSIVAILPQHPIYPASLAILYGINATLRSTEAPYRLQIIDTHGGSESRELALEKEALASVVQEKISGVVLWHMGGSETLPQLLDLEKRGIPVVFVDRSLSNYTCDFVGSDNRAGIETAIEHLRQLGHRRIAHLTTDEQTTAVLERLDAYTDAMLAGERIPRPEWICKVPHDNTTKVGPAYEQFFGLSEPPTAVIAMNDSLAYYFITECQKRGREVPKEISVIGFDDLERHSPRPALLTTLHQPFDKIGRRAADLLLRRLSQPDTPQEARQHILLPTPLIIRTTCCPPPENA